jgi:hypothetical protein
MSEQLTRRGFFRLFGGAAAAVAVAAVAPTYFIPPIGGWKSSTIINPNECTIGHYADYYPPPAELLKTYYSKAFLENIKAQTPFTRMAARRPLPARSGELVNFYRHELGVSA